MFDRKQLRAFIEPAVESFFRTIFFWTQTEQEFGALIIYTHIAFASLLGLTLIAFLLLPLPSFLNIFLIGIFGIMIVQYAVLGTCVMSRLEKRVNGSAYPILKPLFCFYNIPLEVQTGVVYLLSSVIFAFLLLLFLRFSIFVP